MSVELVSLGLACADVMVRPVDEWPERGKLTLVPDIEMHLGGLASVTAAVYRRLGGASALVTKVGSDGFGRFITRELDRQGVDVSRVCVAEGEGSASTAVLIDSHGERTFLHNPGASASLCEEDVDVTAFSSARALHWGGPAVTPGLDGEPIGRIMAKAHGMGLITSMDTCYDGAGKWFSRIEHALPHLTIAMTSYEEARMYMGKDSPEAIADALLAHGPEVAVVKLGPVGVLVKAAGECHRIPSHRVDVRDTTGAGDASCAGFLYAFLHGWGLERCARIANAVGALTVQVMGGSEGVTSFEQVERLADDTDSLRN